MDLAPGAQGIIRGLKVAKETRAEEAQTNLSNQADNSGSRLRIEFVSTVAFTIISMSSLL